MLLLLAWSVGGCYTGPGVDHFAAVLDELAPPADWKLVDTRRLGPDEPEACPVTSTECPAVTYGYLAGTDPAAAVAAAKAMVTGAGFSVVEELGPACDGQPPVPACSFISVRGADAVRVSVHASGHYLEIEDIPPDRNVVMVTARRASGWETNVP